MSTFATFGFSSAVSFATECIDRLHTTAQAHSRILVVEVMGRYAGWIALHSGIAGQADAILIPEIPYDFVKWQITYERSRVGSRQHAIVVVAEGAKPVGGEAAVKSREPGRAERLGGIGGAGRGRAAATRRTRGPMHGAGAPIAWRIARTRRIVF